MAFVNVQDVIPIVEDAQETEPEIVVSEASKDIFVPKSDSPKEEVNSTVVEENVPEVSEEEVVPEVVPVPKRSGRGADKKKRKRKEMTPAALASLAKARQKAAENRKKRAAARKVEKSKQKARDVTHTIKKKASEVIVNQSSSEDDGDYEAFVAYRRFKAKRRKAGKGKEKAKAAKAEVKIAAVPEPPKLKRQVAVSLAGHASHKQSVVQTITRHQAADQDPWADLFKYNC
mgnify:CR=1 FL=1